MVWQLTVVFSEAYCIANDNGPLRDMEELLKHTNNKVITNVKNFVNFIHKITEVVAEVKNSKFHDFLILLCKFHESSYKR